MKPVRLVHKPALRLLPHLCAKRARGLNDEDRKRVCRGGAMELKGRLCEPVFVLKHMW